MRARGYGGISLLLLLSITAVISVAQPVSGQPFAYVANLGDGGSHGARSADGNENFAPGRRRLLRSTRFGHGFLVAPALSGRRAADGSPSRHQSVDG